MENVINNNYVNFLKKINEINYKIMTGKIDNLINLKKEYYSLLKKIESSISDKNEFKKIKEEIEKTYILSLEYYKKIYWGDFAQLNKRFYPEIYDLMIDEKGDLKRLYDSFPGTIALMDFHGYTSFSTNVKYNKTPLLAFGKELPDKITKICKKCHCFVYEVEGDSLIIVGPENPYFVITAVFSIIALARQKKFNKKIDYLKTYGVDFNTSTLQCFEMNASITTSGETYINDQGRVVGSIIAEASRILTVLNTKKPKASGVMINDKIWRNIEKYNNNMNIYNFDSFFITKPFSVDVKGMRLRIREIYLEDKPYLSICENEIQNISKQIRKSAPSKWYNILSSYTQIIITVLKSISLTITFEDQEYNNQRASTLLEQYLVRWIDTPSPDILLKLLSLINIIYKSSLDVRDMSGLFHEFIMDNFSNINIALENFYNTIINEEKSKSRSFRDIILKHQQETDQIKKRYFPRRILETVLSDQIISNNLDDFPYIGKK